MSSAICFNLDQSKTTADFKACFEDRLPQFFSGSNETMSILRRNWFDVASCSCRGPYLSTR